MSTMYERAKKVFSPVAARATTLGVVKSEGSYLYTEDGRKILDFASGVAVNNLGGRHPRVVKAIEKQLETMIHVGHNVVYNESYVELGEKLVELTGGDTMVYFSNSGAEANEGAMKCAKYVTGRPGVIAFRNAFHGRTYGAMSITSSSAAYRKHYEPLMPAVYFVDYPHALTPADDDAAIQKTVDELHELFATLIDPSQVACMILEPVQGEGGYIVPPKNFLKTLRQICDEHGILLIFDEVQCGMGRTGTLYAHEQFGVKPDLFTSAKALGGGIPLSAIIGKKEIMEKWQPGAHGGTFGGNPLACAAALETLKVIEDEHLLENCQKMGSYFKDALYDLQKKYPLITDVRGLGLMIGMQLSDPAKVKAIRTKALAKGVLLLDCGKHNVIRFIAPLNVSKEEIDFCLKVLDECFEEAA